MDTEMPGTSSSSNCQIHNEDEEMSSIATTTTTNDQTDPLPKRSGLESQSGQNQTRKKRFSSRNYRNHLGPNADEVNGVLYGILLHTVTSNVYF